MSVYQSFGLFNGDGDDYPQPYSYQRSHILPAATDPRAGFFDLGQIPAHIARRDYDGTVDEWSDRVDGKVWPWLRVALRGTDDEPDDVILDEDQVRALRDELTGWLERVEHLPSMNLPENLPESQEDAP